MPDDPAAASRPTGPAAPATPPPAPAGPAGDVAGGAAAAPFSERLWPGPGGWTLVGALVVMLAIVLVPLGTAATVLGLLTATGVAVAAVVLLTPRVEVRDGELLAGAAHVALALLGEARVLTGEELRHELGPGLDARAHLCLRGWIGSAVRVELVDPQDPTPYWVVSTRRAQELVAAVAAGRG